MYICVCECVCVFEKTVTLLKFRAYTVSHTYMCMYVIVHIYTHIHTDIHIVLFLFSAPRCMDMHAHGLTYIHTYMLPNMDKHVITRMHAHARSCTHVHTYMLSNMYKRVVLDLHPRMLRYARSCNMYMYINIGIHAICIYDMI